MKIHKPIYEMLGVGYIWQVHAFGTVSVGSLKVVKAHV
jgi:hypothetical protein